MKWFLIFVLAIGLAAFMGWDVFSQNTQAGTVPNVVGLTVPQAAAALHQAGLRLGVPTVVYEESGQSDTVRTQSVQAGMVVNPATAIDVEVLVVFNFSLIYDNNDITIANLTGETVRIGNMRFSSGGEGDIPQTAFMLRDMNGFGGQLEHRQCAQIWSDAADSAKPVATCERGVRNWFSTILPERHFWTGGNGADTFTVSLSDTLVGSCPVARRNGNERSCPLRVRFDPGDTDTAEYVYLVYTTRKLAVVNRSASRWMLLDNVEVGNRLLDDTSQLPRIAALGEHETRLAPDECLLFSAPPSNDGTAEAETDELAEDCFSVGQTTFTVEAFWRNAFTVQGANSYTCPAAQPDQPVICLVPR